MKATRKTSKAEKRRMRVAGTTVAVFICAFLVLVAFDFRGNPANSPGFSQHLFAETFEVQDDPLNLVNRITGFELIGVSEDGRVIGYASDMPWQQSSVLLTMILQVDGWVLLDNNGQGLLSFQRDVTGAEVATGATSATGATGATGATNTTGTTCLFIQCLSSGQGSSIVIQRWQI